VLIALAGAMFWTVAWATREVDGRVSGRRVFGLAVVLAGSLWEAALLRQGFTGTSVFVTNVLLVIAAAVIAGRPHPDR
jgi:hypothetical protein